MGTLFAVFQTDGINNREIDRSNKYDSGPESDSDRIFKRILGYIIEVHAESWLEAGQNFSHY